MATAESSLQLLLLITRWWRARWRSHDCRALNDLLQLLSPFPAAPLFRGPPSHRSRTPRLRFLPLISRSVKSVIKSSAVRTARVTSKTKSTYKTCHMSRVCYNPSPASWSDPHPFYQIPSHPIWSVIMWPPVALIDVRLVVLKKTKWSRFWNVAIYVGCGKICDELISGATYAEGQDVI